MTKIWSIVETAAGFEVHHQTEGSSFPITVYPNKRAAASRVLQLLDISPVAPQSHPERVEITLIEDAKPAREYSREEINPRDRGLPMSEIRVGMRLRHTVDTILPVITVTGHTEKGFSYKHERFFWRPGEWSEGGECYGQDGFSYYKPEIEDGSAHG